MKTTRIIVALILVLILVGCSGGGKDESSKEQKPMTISEFEEKYHRADFDAFLKDPTEFLKDLMAINDVRQTSQDELPFNDWEEYASDGSKENNTRTSSRKKDCVLFNKAFTLNVMIFYNDKAGTANYLVSVDFDTGDVEKDLEIARSVYFGFISICGDPTKLNSDGKDVNENVIVRILDGSDPPASFHADFESGYMSFYAYKFSSGYSSHIHVCP